MENSKLSLWTKFFFLIISWIRRIWWKTSIYSNNLAIIANVENCTCNCWGGGGNSELASMLSGKRKKQLVTPGCFPQDIDSCCSIFLKVLTAHRLCWVIIQVSGQMSPSQRGIPDPHSWLLIESPHPNSTASHCIIFVGFNFFLALIKIWSHLFIYYYPGLSISLIRLWTPKNCDLVGLFSLYSKTSVLIDVGRRWDSTIIRLMKTKERNR